MRLTALRQSPKDISRPKNSRQLKQKPYPLNDIYPQLHCYWQLIITHPIKYHQPQIPDNCTEPLTREDSCETRPQAARRPCALLQPQSDRLRTPSSALTLAQSSGHARTNRKGIRDSGKRPKDGGLQVTRTSPRSPGNNAPPQRLLDS
jgi:hypothetical protein